MLNFFKKTPSSTQKSVLGLEVFSQAESEEFLKLVREDLQKRAIVVGDFKVGYLAVKIDGKDMNFGLSNLAQNCKLAKREQWHAVIKDHFDSVEKSRTEQKNLEKNIADFDKIKSLLAIQLYPDQYFDAHPDMRNVSVIRSSIPTVNTTLVFDLSNSIRPVTKAELKLWKKTEDDLFGLALKNTLEKIKPQIIERPGAAGKVSFITADSFLAAVLVLDLKKFPQCIGLHGSLVSIPARGTVMCYPINDLGVVKTINDFIAFAHRLNLEGPGSLSPNLYWYNEGKFIDIPYVIKDKNLNVTPPRVFVDMLNRLSPSKV